MITVIDQPTLNLYEGMSISEALDNMVIGVYEACNEFTMDCLLTEHAYLYENATEITYVNEDGSENSNGVSLKEKFFAAVDKVKTMFSELFKKIIDFIAEHTEGIRRKMASIGLTEKKVNSAIEYIKANNVEFAVETGGWATKGKIEGYINAGIGSFIKDSDADHPSFGPGAYLGKVSEEIKQTSTRKNIEVREITDAVEVVLKTTLLSDIKKARKEADDALNSLKKDIKSDRGAENFGERLGRANDALKSNANLVKDLIKIFNKFYLANAAILSKLIKVAGSDKFEKKVEPIKTKAGEVKAKAGEKAEGIKTGAKTAAGNVKDAAGRAAGSVKQAAKTGAGNIRGALDKLHNKVNPKEKVYNL